MSEFIDGSVAICATGQAGTIIQLTGNEAWVLLRNGDIWVGLINRIRLPQDSADLEACPIDIERFDAKY